MGEITNKLSSARADRYAIQEELAAVGMAAMVLVFMLSSCSVFENPVPIPPEVAELEGTWVYDVSLVWAEDTVVTQRCGIVGTTLVIGEAVPSDLPSGYPFTFDGQITGGTLTCTGDGEYQFVSNLGPDSGRAERAGFVFTFDFDIETPTEVWNVQLFSYPPPVGFPEHVISAALIKGTVRACGPDRPCARGWFTAVRP